MPEILTGEEMLAPGVRGYAVETDHGLYVPFVGAVVEGSGDVGRYLDSLPRDRRVVVPNVISARLAAMLERRGFDLAYEFAPEWGEMVEIYVREGGQI